MAAPRGATSAPGAPGAQSTPTLAGSAWAHHADPRDLVLVFAPLPALGVDAA